MSRKRTRWEVTLRVAEINDDASVQAGLVALSTKTMFLAITPDAVTDNDRQMLRDICETAASELEAWLAIRPPS